MRQTALSSKEQGMSQGKTSVVLAHGAWADGSSWRKVIERLNQQGVNVVAAPLPLTSLRDDVAALERTLERIDGPVVLVGHAYAGAVIGATTAANVAALVYVAALAPDEGETVADVFYRGKTHPLAPQLAPDAHGWIWLPHEAFATAFAQHATAEEAAGLAAIQRPIAAACIGEAVGRPLWRDRPAWFLVAGEDRMIDPDTQRFMASRMNAQIREHDVDHTPSVTAPDLVSEVILEAVQSASSR
jgi:pimeloyl-ACP methyl ester carboxylesterase